MSLAGAFDVLTDGERARHPGPLVLQAYFDGWNQAIGRSPTVFPRFLDNREEREWRLGWADGKKAGPPPEPERAEAPEAVPEPPAQPVALAPPPSLPRDVPYPPVDGSQPCAQADPEAWFPERGASPREAKQVCESCEFRQPCRDYAVAATFAGYPVMGVWGGTTENERRAMRREEAAA